MQRRIFDGVCILDARIDRQDLARKVGSTGNVVVVDDVDLGIDELQLAVEQLDLAREERRGALGETVLLPDPSD